MQLAGLPKHLLGAVEKAAGLRSVGGFRAALGQGVSATEFPDSADTPSSGPHPCPYLTRISPLFPHPPFLLPALARNRLLTQATGSGPDA